MKIRTFFFLLLLLCAACASNTTFLYSATVNIFEDLFNPATISVDKDHIYICQEERVFIFSATDYSFIKSFGGEGEKPGQFILMPSINLVPDIQTPDLIVNSLGRVSYFTREGTFKKEIKTTPNAYPFYPLGNGFAGTSALVESDGIYRTINCYDSKLEKGKEIIRRKHEFQEGKGLKLLTGPFAFHTHGNKLYVAADADFKIDVYDEKGQKISTIKSPYQHTKVTQLDRLKILAYLKASVDTKDLFQNLKPITFADQFPAILDFLVSGKNIYLLTWKKEKRTKENGTMEETTQLVVLDLEGKEVKKIFLPIKYRHVLEPYPYTVKDGLFYQLVENPVKKKWELHIFEL